MDFIKNDAAPAQAVKKALGVHQHPTYAGKFTVEVLDFGQGLAEASFAYAPNPDNHITERARQARSMRSSQSAVAPCAGIIAYSVTKRK